MRHLGQIGHHRRAADVLAECQGERRGVVGVDAGREHLGEAHRLPLGVGDLQTHTGLARDGLDHADAAHRQRTRQVLDQIDDLAALHASGGLDLVAGDDRTWIGGEHLHVDAELTQLVFDQARGELERLDRRALDRGGGLVEQGERRQTVSRQVGEQRPLLFLVNALRDLRWLLWGHDPDRRARTLPHLIGHHRLTLCRGARPQTAVAPGLERTPATHRSQLDQRTDPLSHVEPGHAGQQAHPGHQQCQQQQCGAGHAKPG